MTRIEGEMEQRERSLPKKLDFFCYHQFWNFYRRLYFPKH